MKAVSDRVEFVSVISLSLGYFILVSLLSAFRESSSQTIFSDSSLQFLIAYESVILLILSAFLVNRGWSLRAMGLTPRRRDLAVGTGLAVIAYLSYSIVFLVAASVIPGIDQTRPAGINLSLATVLVVSLLNPVFEEIFVCGYVISYFKRSKRGFWYAVNFSIALRLLYHLYQGAYAVVSIVPIGLVFTYWFARTGRLWPVIIAHAIFDFFALVEYV